MCVENIQSKRLTDYFIALCEIDSPGLQERQIAEYLRTFFAQFPTVSVEEDDSARITGADTGNLVVTIPGNNNSATALFFNCHMDVVTPCTGVQVDFAEGVFSSKGDTVLGGDDKAGIAILMELTHLLFEHEVSHPLIQLIFTTGEEIGLLGAKQLNLDLIQAKYGYALDSTGIDNGIIGAPASDEVDVLITGKAAHAGLNPEDGISAIVLCGKAISLLPLGRIDSETTANIGKIVGGTATNIIPEQVQIEGEIRSHDLEKLEKIKSEFEQVFTETCTQAGGWAEISFAPQYPLMLIDQNSSVVKRLKRCSVALGRELELIVAGGGSDANIFNSRGLPTVILGTGMTDVHSVNEKIALADIKRTAELVVALVTC